MVVLEDAATHQIKIVVKDAAEAHPIFSLK
jgi:hypothetical protein